MEVEQDPRVVKEMRKLEARERREAVRAQAELRRQEKDVEAEDRGSQRAVQKFVLFVALALAGYLLWQKVHIIVFIPGTYMFLVVVFVGLAGLIYWGMRRIGRLVE